MIEVPAFSARVLRPRDKVTSPAGVSGCRVFGVGERLQAPSFVQGNVVICLPGSGPKTCEVLVADLELFHGASLRRVCSGLAAYSCNLDDSLNSSPGNRSPIACN